MWGRRWAAALATGLLLGSGASETGPKPWGRGFLTQLAAFRAQLDGALGGALLGVLRGGEAVDRLEHPPVVWRPVEVHQPSLGG